MMMGHPMTPRERRILRIGQLLIAIFVDHVRIIANMLVVRVDMWRLRIEIWALRTLMRWRGLDP